MLVLGTNMAAMRVFEFKCNNGSKDGRILEQLYAFGFFHNSVYSSSYIHKRLPFDVCTCICYCNIPMQNVL